MNIENIVDGKLVDPNSEHWNRESCIWTYPTLEKIGEDCVRFNGLADNGKWNDARCKDENEFICEQILI